jgi:predicted RNase H-like HicB family nuclease
MRFTHWKEDDGKYLDYLKEYPEHRTQGETLEDLKNHLLDLYQIFTSEVIPRIRKEELESA